MHSRFGIIGDVHTEAETLLRALEHLQAIGAERLLCVGDLPDGPGDAFDVDECCQLLKRYEVTTVCGNHDRWLLEDTMRDLRDATVRLELEPETIEYLQGLPSTRDIETTLGTFLLCHGMGADDMARVEPHDHGYAIRNNEPLQALLRAKRYPAVINGHTHRRMVRRVGNLTIINAGTLHREYRPCFACLDTEHATVDYFAPTGETLEHFSLTVRDA